MTCMCHIITPPIPFKMKELEIPKSVAEKSLQSHGGDIIKTLCTLTA